MKFEDQAGKRMVNDNGSGSVTDCLLRSFSDHRRHQQCRAAPRQKSKQTQPIPTSSPINYPAYPGLFNHQIFNHDDRVEEFMVEKVWACSLIKVEKSGLEMSCNLLSIFICQTNMTISEYE